jgi:hypothetical protein
MSSGPEKATRGTLRYVDDRLGSAGFLRRSFNKVFPDHWSFMLGEIALYSFVILLLTGTYLTLFFHASSAEVIYNGSYQPLKGVAMTEAYASTLHISFDVRGGLLMRQIHHWAALLFVSSIVVHLFRVFFTGAFRKPRSTGTSGSGCSCWPSSKASPATPCPTTCSPAPGSGSRIRSSRASRSSAPTSPTSSSAVSTPAPTSSQGCSSSMCC